MDLAPCSGCRRHIDRHATACPFCADGTPGAPPPARIVQAARFTRAAMFYLGATTAAACGGEQPLEPPPEPPALLEAESPPQGEPEPVVVDVAPEVAPEPVPEPMEAEAPSAEHREAEASAHRRADDVGPESTRHASHASGYGAPPATDDLGGLEGL